MARLMSGIRAGLPAAEIESLLGDPALAPLGDEVQAELRALAEHVAAAHARRMLDGVVHELSLDLALKRDRQSALATIVKRARAVLGTDIAYVSLNDFEAGETYIHTVDGVITNEFRSIRMPFGRGVLGFVAQADVPSQTADYFGDAALRATRLAHVDEAVQREGVRAILGAPLKIEGRVIGALLVADRHPHRFEPGSVEVIAAMSALAAVALETTQLLDELTESLQRLNESQEESRRHVAHLERLEHADEVLIASLASMEGRTRLASDLEQLLDASTEIIEVGDLGEGGTDVHALAEESAAAGMPIGRTGPEGTNTVMAAVVHGQIAGAVRVGAALDDAATAILQRAAMTLSAQLLFERAIVEADTREQSELLELLIATGIDAHPRSRRRFASYGIEADRPLGVVSLGGEDRDAVGAFVTRLLGRSALTATHSDHVCVVLRTDDVSADGARLVAALADAGLPASAGCVEHRGGGPLRAAHARARGLSRALEALGITGRAVDEASMGSVGLMLGNADDDLPRAVLQRSLGPVLEHDADHQTQLLRTAAVYLDNGRSVVRAASALHYHQNTVRQRLERIDQLLGPDWRDGPRSLDIHLALRIWQLLGSSTP